MRLLLKSKIYQLEIQRWILIICLFIWAMISSIFAIRNQKETLVIGIDPTGFARLIESRNDRYIQEELKSFLKEYISRAFTYNEKNYSEQISKSADLMSNKLWEEKRSQLIGLGEKLKNETLEQTAKIESLDLLEGGQIEGVLFIQVNQKLNKQTFRVKISFQVKPKERSPMNPWGYELWEATDAPL